MRDSEPRSKAAKRSRGRAGRSAGRGGWWRGLGRAGSARSAGRIGLERLRGERYVVAGAPLRKRPTIRRSLQRQHRTGVELLGDLGEPHRREQQVPRRRVGHVAQPVRSVGAGRERDDRPLPTSLVPSGVRSSSTPSSTSSSSSLAWCMWYGAAWPPGSTSYSVQPSSRAPAAAPTRVPRAAPMSRSHAVVWKTLLESSGMDTGSRIGGGGVRVWGRDARLGRFVELFIVSSQAGGGVVTQAAVRGYLGRGPGGRSQNLQSGGPAALPHEGAGEPRRVRPNAVRGAVPSRAALVRSRGRAQPHRRRRRARADQRGRARGDRGSGVPDRAGAVQHRDQRAAPAARGRGVLRARVERARQPQRRRGQGADGRRAHDDHRHPADGRREASERRLVQREPAVRAAQRAGVCRTRGGPGDNDRRRRTALDPCGHDRAGGRVHERSAPPAGRARGVRSLLERGAGDRRRAGRGGGELAVLLRQGAVARDPDRAVRAGDRHATGGAEDPGRAPARVVRRGLDHLDLRSVRGERALLPIAAARLRRGGSARRRSSAATSRG